MVTPMLQHFLLVDGITHASFSKMTTRHSTSRNFSRNAIAVWLQCCQFGNFPTPHCDFISTNANSMKLATFPGSSRDFFGILETNITHVSSFSSSCAAASASLPQSSHRSYSMEQVRQSCRCNQERSGEENLIEETLAALRPSSKWIRDAFSYRPRCKRRDLFIIALKHANTFGLQDLSHLLTHNFNNNHQVQQQHTNTHCSLLGPRYCTFVARFWSKD